MRKVAPVLFLVILLQLCFIPFASAAPPFGPVGAQAALLIDRDNGTILYDYQIHRRQPADNLSKVMMLLIAAQAVENDEISDSEIIEMTEDAWLGLGEDSPTQSITEGQMMTFIDLMYSAFTGNASEACNMIAIRMAGSVESFVYMMNAKAAELGCSDTNFVNVHGAYHENQYTTAYDMYVLYSEALNCKLFDEIASTYRHVTERTEETESRTLVSNNAMLNQNSIYYYRYCRSGFASDSYEGGMSLVAAAEEDGLTLISVVLGAREVIHEDNSVTLHHFSDTNRLFIWGFDNFAWRDIVRVTDLLARVPVEHGSGADYVNVRPERSLTLLLDNAITTESFTQEITIFSEVNDTPLVAPVSAGDVLGEVVISRNGVVYDTIDLIANTDIGLNGMEYIRRQTLDFLSTPLARNIIIVLVIIVLIYAALVIRYNIMRINRLRRIRNAKNELIRQRHEEFRDY